MFILPFLLSSLINCSTFSLFSVQPRKALKIQPTLSCRIDSILHPIREIQSRRELNHIDVNDLKLATAELSKLRSGLSSADDAVIFSELITLANQLTQVVLRTVDPFFELSDEDLKSLSLSTLYYIIDRLSYCADVLSYTRGLLIDRSTHIALDDASDKIRELRGGVAAEIELKLRSLSSKELIFE